MTAKVRPSATPRARWSAWDVSAGDILGFLARQRATDVPGHPGAPAGALNLVAVAEGGAERRTLADIIGHLGAQQPMRALVVHLSDVCQGMNATVTSENRSTPGDGCTARELIELELPSAHSGRLAAAVGPLLRHDLPTVLWWPRTPRLGGGVEGLYPLVDRLITEANRDRDDDAHALWRLATHVHRTDLPTTDLTWAAITPWRHLVAQMIDRESLARMRAAGVAVTIGHGGTTATAESLLLGGWLTDMIGGRTRVQLVTEPLSHERLAALDIEGASSGRRLHVEMAADGNTVLVRVGERDGRRRERMLPLYVPERARLLARELELRHRDRVFERALAATAAKEAR